MPRLATDTPQLLTQRDVSARFRISRSTLWRMRRDGALPFVMVRGSVRYRESDLIDLIERSEVTR